MHVAVVTFPGSNCVEDATYAMGAVLGASAFTVWHTADTLESGGKPADAVVIPGGFSYGDYLRCGALAAHSPVMKAVTRFAESGGPVLGICNGFQVLTEAGLLPGQLARNAGLRFTCKDVHLGVARTDLPFTHRAAPGQVLRLPVAHADGRYYVGDQELAEIEARGQVVFRYVDEAGNATPEANVNGSRNSIAGLTNARGNVLGMMPHPERAVEALLGGEDGRVILESLLSA